MQPDLRVVGLAAPLLLLLAVSLARLVQRDADFGPVALLAAGVYLMIAAPVSSWLAGKGFLDGGLGPGDALLLAGYGGSLAIRGAGLVSGGAEWLIIGAGTACLGVIAWRARGSER